MFCERCGEELTAGVIFCEKCGARVTAVPAWSDPSYYDPWSYGWKYGYRYRPYVVKDRLNTYFWQNVAMLFLLSPACGVVGVILSRQAAIMDRNGLTYAAQRRAETAGLVFWIGSAVGVVATLAQSIARWEELLDLAAAM